MTSIDQMEIRSKYFHPFLYLPRHLKIFILYHSNPDEAVRTIDILILY
jgi:hypothetical protein